MRKARVETYMNPYLAGILLGGVLFGSFILTGHGLGASGGMSRIVSFAVDVAAPGHTDRNPELAGLAGGDRRPLNNWLVWEIIGVALGGFISGWLAGRLRLETRKGPRITNGTRYAAALAGGTLVGYAARLARGCTSGQALSGGAILSAGSWAFMFSVFGGGYAVAYFMRKLWN